MTDETKQKIARLEETLSFLLTPTMTREEKIKALSDSFWRSHNAGFCDYIAGIQMGGIENAQTRLHDLDCTHKASVVCLLELLEESEESNRNPYCLVMKWDYTYDKESTWFDKESGKETYDLTEGASYPLPHIRKKCMEIRSVTTQGDSVCAEIYLDYHTVTVSNDGEPVIAYASDSYSVAGDSVHQSLTVSFTIEAK